MTEHATLPEPTRCRTCHAEIAFVRNIESGRLMPLDPFPAEDGNVVLESGGCRVLTKAEAASGAFSRRYKSHFSTCKDAAAWRKSA